MAEISADQKQQGSPYVGNEAIKACQFGYIDNNGLFHLEIRRFNIPNTGDKGFLGYLTDDDETMWIERNPKRRRLRIRWIRTGVGRNVMIFGGIGLVAIIALAVLFVKRKKATKTGK